MQLAAFVCVICAICGRITHTRVLNQLHKEAPMSLANLADNAEECSVLHYFAEIIACLLCGIISDTSRET
jgi:hypothetical protein